MDKVTKRQKNIVRQNVIESLKDIGGGTISGLKSDVLRPGDFMEQLFGPPKMEKYSAETTQDLGQELQIASMQAPVEPGLYHVIFFEKLLEFLKSFRKKIEAGSIWLQATNKRAAKKIYWGPVLYR